MATKNIINLSSYKLSKLKNTKSQLEKEIDAVDKQYLSLVKESPIENFVTQVIDLIRENISPNPQIAKIQIDILVNIIRYNYSTTTI